MSLSLTWRRLSLKMGFFICLFCLGGLPLMATGEAGQADTAPRSIYPASPVISGVSFDWSTHQRLAPGSDNWPITWADDDQQYTSWGDGGGFGGTNDDSRVSLGFGRVDGEKDSYQGANLWGGKDAADLQIQREILRHPIGGWRAVHLALRRRIERECL